MTPHQKIEFAEKRIKELQLLITVWKEGQLSNKPIELEALQDISSNDIDIAAA
tara:strand:- start:363 stop:521 length:159 start_codon:yes stop_codon:yes gene_type:complete